MNVSRPKPQRSYLYSCLKKKKLLETLLLICILKLNHKQTRPSLTRQWNQGEAAGGAVPPEQTAKAGGDSLEAEGSSEQAIQHFYIVK